MLYHLLYPLRDLWGGFNVFRYITFRAAFASVSSFLIVLVIGPWLINLLKNFNINQQVRRKHVGKLYDLHKDKVNTPTMGGVLIIVAIIISTLLWADCSNRYVVTVLMTTLFLGLIGFADDVIKLKSNNSKGLTILTKLTGQLVVALAISIVILMDPFIDTTLYVPFFKNIVINLSFFYSLFVILVITSSSNAVNFTDGLDGLAAGCMVMIALSYGAMSYITGHAEFSQYLQIIFIPQAGELAVFCSAVAGACLGFLWFNSYPATIVMGDTGSLALGGAIGALSCLIKKEILMFLVGGIFVIEALSVLLQIGSFRLFGKRIFLMAPIHHHFQLKGWPESKVTIRFWIVQAILSLFALATLKLR